MDVLYSFNRYYLYTDGRITFNLEELHIPSSHDEIVTVIQKAYKNEKAVRV